MIRLGFISNSSSSSFVICKRDVPDACVSKLDDLILTHNENSSEGYIEELSNHYAGRIDYHEFGDAIDAFCIKHGIPMDMGD